MELKAGTRLRSQVCTTEVIVVRPPTEPLELTCGGHPMVALDASPAPGLVLVDIGGAGAELGKRYTDESATFEVLVTKAGAGALGNGSVPLVLKAAKPLPSSD